ncbi:MAG TPA: hypothetical protein VI383_02315, partial [Gemmatimonadales bacterium]|nr:hypothetical protein [Gemmatimonadales bacterium]
MTSIRFLAFLSALTAVPALAQSPAAGSPGPKRPLTQADWDRWRSITGAVMSRDGRWAAYTLVPLVGDGELVVRATRGETEYRVPRGYLGRPNNVPGGLRPAAGANPEAAPVGPTASPAQFSADSRFVVVTVQPSQAEVVRTERASRGGGGPA